MVDKNQLKVADQVDLADDDPFAELTRIMGFDPRQPARQAAQEKQSAAVEPQARETAEDDFSLDLEKELLGGFDLGDDRDDAAAEAEAAAEAAAPVQAPETPEVDFDFSAALDAAMAEPEQAEAAFEPEIASDNAPEIAAEAEAEFDLGFTEDDIRALDAETVEPASVEPDTEHTEAEFDLGLTEEDVRALDDQALHPSEPVESAPIEAAPVEAAPVAPAPAVDAGFDDGEDFEADFDAAMADIDMPDIDLAGIDMEFSADTSASEPVGAAADEIAAPIKDETIRNEAVSEENVRDGAEADLHLFDESDFSLEEESAPVVETGPGEPEFDDSAFSLGLDELGLVDVHPAEEQPASAANEYAFDDIDFAVSDLAADAEPEGAVEGFPVEAGLVDPVEAESSLPFEASPSFEQHPFEQPAFEQSAPRSEPRKLPVSPMDVAADEFRQREAVAAAAEPGFNLEDELNALLGNIKANQAAAAAPAAEPIFEPAYQSQVASSGPAPDPEAFLAERMAEISGFDAPATPADITDDLNWELDDGFAEEAGAEEAGPGDVSYGDDRFGDDSFEEGQPHARQAQGYEQQYEQEQEYEQGLEYEAGGYRAYGHQAEHQAEPEQDGSSYAEEEQSGVEQDRYDVYADEPALAELDEVYGQPAEDGRRDDPSPHYGGAFAGAAAAGAAAGAFGSGMASRASESSSWLPERFAVRQQAAEAGEPHSSHRDPVVRGNPMKEDPLDIITALAAKYSKKEPVTPYGRAMSVAAGAAPYVDEAGQDEDIDISAAFEEQPDVETVEVADRAVALADDLDIPELAEEEEFPPVSAYDDLDAEFASLLSDMNSEPHAAQASGGFDARSHQGQTAASNGQAPSAHKSYDDDPEPGSFAFDADDLPGSRMPSGSGFEADDYDYDPDAGQEITAPHHLAAESRQQPRSRGMLLAALVGGVALVGAVGAFALSFGGGSGGDAPAIVRADDGPVKVKPENPGGATVPNQDNKVYETVAGEGTADAPQQEKLVTTAEEPVDVTPPPPAVEEQTASASGKSEDRIEQILQEAENQTDAEIVAVAPRKVRTLVVRPDGTLVPREDEPASAGETETVAAAVPEAPAPEATGALTAAAGNAPEPVLVPTVPEMAPTADGEAEALPPAQEQVAATEPASDDRGAMPETAPIAPLRPADQPIDVVGEVKPDQVAAVTTATSNGNWAMQIASQPSEAAAQSSYQNLVRRYGSVLEGKEVNIVKAEIAGKGTFWRVRVPAESRNEAIGLCETYKAAGGNCFVSR